MDTKELYDLKLSNLQKVLNRQEPDYIPNMIHNHMATIAWAGKRAVDVLHDPQEYVKALNAVYGEMWVDANIQNGNPLSGTPRLEKVLGDPINRFGPDGTTPEHLQRSMMKADEYDQLIADPDKYATEVILPRVHTKLFEDEKTTEEILKVYAQDKLYMMIQLPQMVEQDLAETYGVPSMLNMQENYMTPLDILFDFFRGFRGTLTDLRRQPENVKKALESIWNVRCAAQNARPYVDNGVWAPQMPHIPAYLSPKQYEEYYWPHQKKQIERIAEGGGKAYIILEGRWKSIWHHFLELPKDCCILHWDDDDFIETYQALGQHQIVIGGLRTSDVRLKSFDKIKDELKRTIDTCAPGGGFLFCTDKSWIAPGDVNQTLIDAYNFAHEYSKK